MYKIIFTTLGSNVARSVLVKARSSAAAEQTVRNMHKGALVWSSVPV